ncbi:MAG TPA: 30S ribosomal protein S17e [Acidobacteriota bacterium]|nr:30S ribosomal protein S17e [Acidobacteriota bacterium]
MGRIKTKRIKRYTRRVMKETEFTGEFGANKGKFMEVAKAHSKKIRNIIAGYATRLVKKAAEKQ